MDEDQEREHRRHLVEALHTASRDFDRAIMTLAAGALGLSIVFVHDVAPDPVCTWLLAFLGGRLRSAFSRSLARS